MAITEICSKEQCTGCSACMASCEAEAIEMTRDEMGYIYPEIMADICVGCGRCRKVCPANNPVSKAYPMVAFALFSEDERNSSASGGAASVAARIVLSGGGVVYGSVQNCCTDIKHQCISDLREYYRMKGSKYVHSSMENCFRDCRQDLKDNKRVLFTGTPCQIAGLRNFLSKDYPNLITMDIVCHGVPSMQLLSDHIAYIKDRHGITTEDAELKVAFRKKNRLQGKLECGFYLGEVENVFPNDYYITGFISGLFLRENCFRCQYACNSRVADLTIGDFWGIGKKVPSKMNVNEGVSEVLINTDKGRAFFEDMQSIAVVEKRDVDEAISGNGQLNEPLMEPKDYKSFRLLYLEKGYADACEHYIPSYIKSFARKSLRQYMANMMRGILCIGK